MPELKLVRLGSISSIAVLFEFEKEKKNMKEYSNSFFFSLIYIIFHFRVFSSKVGIALRRESQSRSRKTSLSAPIVCPAFHTGICTHTARCNNEEAGGIRLKRSNHRCILQALLERQGESDIGWPEKKK